MNGKRPVRNKIDRAEDTLAKKWSKLMKDKLNLSDELFAETNELQAQLHSLIQVLIGWLHGWLHGCMSISGPRSAIEVIPRTNSPRNVCDA